MKSNRVRGVRRFAAAATLTLVATTLAGGCGNDGGAGDGVIDDGNTMPPGGSSSGAGQSGSVAGAPSSVAGSAGNVGGSAGLTGVSGSAGSSGSAGTAGNAGSAVKSAGGSAGTTGSAGSTTTGGSSGSPSGGAGGSSGGAAGGGTAGSAGTTSGAGGSGGAGTSTTCGDGALQGSEVCDDGPAYIVASSAGSGGSSAESGGSSAGSGGSSAGTGGGGMINPNYGATCSSDCSYKVSTQACVDCEQDGDCLPFTQNCIAPGNAVVPFVFNAAQSAQCFAVMHCIEASNCFDGTGTLGKCYCGTLSTSACGAAPFSLTASGAPNGACAALIQAGMTGFTTNSAILGSLTGNAKPAGAAMQRLNCQKIASNDCLDVCGFTSGGPAFP